MLHGCSNSIDHVNSNSSRERRVSGVGRESVNITTAAQHRPNNSQDLTLGCNSRHKKAVTFHATIMLLMLLSAAGSGHATPSHSASPALVTLALVLACSSISPVSPASSCRVYSGLGQPCVFPFRYNGEFFTECTNKFGQCCNFILFSSFC